LAVAGAVLVLVGALAIVGAYVADSQPYVPPPGCETWACPSSDFSTDAVRLYGMSVVALGIAIILVGKAVSFPRPLTRVEEEKLLQAVERTTRRSD
jgi:hypothetical protein